MSCFILGREETITEHALFWNRRKVLNLAESVAKRYSKVKVVEICNHIFIDMFINIYKYISLSEVTSAKNLTRRA